MMDAVRCSLLIMAAILSATEAEILKDTNKYPACLVDDDCLSYHKLADHACFQYFCYPYKKAQEELKASEAKELSDLPPCSRKRPCKQPVSVPDKKPSEIECFKHHDKRRVSIGVCVGESENRDCVAHSDCTGDAGGRCCNGYCCSEEYFNAIKRLPCNGDLGCQDLLLGETCCIDVMNSLNFTTPRPNWEKICCDNPRGAVVQPPKDLDDQQMGKISKQIERMPHGGMDQVICNGFEYDFMLRVPACQRFSTTTTTTTTTTTVTTTQKIVKEYPQGRGGGGCASPPCTGGATSTHGMGLFLLLVTLTPKVLAKML